MTFPPSPARLVARSAEGQDAHAASDPSAAAPQRPGARVDTEVELTFPASDPPAFTPEGGLRMDAEPLHQPLECSLAVRRFVVDGLLATWQREAAAQAWLSTLEDAAAPPLRSALSHLLPGTGQRMEWLQRALACFGTSHETLRPAAVPAPGAAAALQGSGGPLFDLAAAVAVRLDREAALASLTLLEHVARAAGLSDAAGFLERCTASTRQDMEAIAQAAPDRLVPAAIENGGEPLPGALVQQAFGVMPEQQGPER